MLQGMKGESIVVQFNGKAPKMFGNSCSAGFEYRFLARPNFVIGAEHRLLFQAEKRPVFGLGKTTPGHYQFIACKTRSFDVDADGPALRQTNQCK